MNIAISNQKMFQLVSLGLIILTSGCATTGYWADRGRDARDIFTLQVGYGLGAKARVGPVQSGLLADIGGVGIRGGEALGIKDFWPKGCDQPAKQDYVGLVVGREALGGNDVSNRRGKSFASKQILFASYPLTHPDNNQRIWLEEHHMLLKPASCYSQIEVVAAAGISLRIGFNPGEMLDFLLGGFGLDIFHDDLSKLNANAASSRRRGRQEQRPAPRAQSALPPGRSAKITNHALNSVEAHFSAHSRRACLHERCVARIVSRPRNDF